MRRRLLVALACTTALAAPALAQTADKAGVAAAVNPDAQGTPPAAAPRTLEIGLDVFRDELVETGDAGQAQMLFLDGSSLTVGPNASLTIDEFAYDPTAATGSLAMSVAKGTLRFVGGRISKGEAVEIETPTAVIGIRGGVALVSVDGATGTTNATLVFGDQLSVQSKAGGGRVNITRPGYTTTVAPQQQQPAPPAKAPAEQLSQQLGQLEGRPGANGGAPQPPTDQRVAQAPVTQTNAAAPPPPPPGARPGPVAEPTQTTPTETTRLTQDASQTAGETQKQTQTQTGPTFSTVPRQVSFALAPDPSLGSQMPFIRGSAGGNLGPAIVTPLFASIPAGDPESDTNFHTRFLQASFAVDGSGPGQRSVIVVATGSFDPAVNDTLLTNDVVGGFVSTFRDTNFSAPNPTARGGLLSGGGGNGGVETSSDPTGFPPDTIGLTADANDPARDGPGPGGTYGFAHQGTRVPNPPALGTPRTNRVLNGFAVGVSDVVARGGSPASPGTADIVGTGPMAGEFSLETDAASSRIGGQMTLFSLGPAFGSPVPLGVTVLPFGHHGTPGTNEDRGTFIDDEVYAARESVDTAGNRLATIGGSAADTSRYYVISAHAVPLALPGPAECSCDFVDWGWWGGQISQSSSFVPGSDESLDRVHLGTWVAGVLTDASDMPTSMTATYTGHAVGTVVTSAGARFVERGGFTAAYDFGSRVMTATLAGFAGGTYQGTFSNGGPTNQ
ncbi:MAG TPA: FecR domain-containing protein, partial [Alphaproteobacteria bacterium]|nr:FecR domain-containing protein [Alphaproteobacteria bacterium]